MKYVHIAAAAIAAAVSGSAMAGAYVQADVGQGHVSLDCAGTVSCNNDGYSFGLTGGWAFGSGLAAEFGYTRYGVARATIEQGQHLHEAAGAFKLGVAYTLPLGSDWRTDFRYGVAQVRTTVGAWDSETNTFLGTLNQTATKPYLGLGVAYAITPSLHARLGGEWTKSELMDGVVNLRAISMGLRYGF